MQAVRKADTASETSETSFIDLPRHLTEFRNENSSNGKSSHEVSAHKPVPPVFVTELSTHEIKLPAIREEKTQEEIMLRECSASKILSEQTPDNMTTTHLREKDNNSKASTKATKHAQSKTPNKQAPSIQISADNKDNAPIEGTFDISEASTFSKENVPSLPALDGSQLSLNHGQESARTEDTSGSNVSLNWKTAIKFVNQRVQDRLTKVDIVVSMNPSASRVVISGYILPVCFIMSGYVLPVCASLALGSPGLNHALKVLSK
ncbi:hypothetical protein DPMN_059414 [Dreissena polymorpha]|uniref:Uncharacterized protein n=1 Tax=Dreissena polymorpha TaxID=45954 RepID=A0A9D4HGM1_DREPO|nr:hypothetical protein DPMN_059414 [Dreissena polymorpha]